MYISQLLKMLDERNFTKVEVYKFILTYKKSLFYFLIFSHMNTLKIAKIREICNFQNSSKWTEYRGEGVV